MKQHVLREIAGKRSAESLNSYCQKVKKQIGGDVNRWPPETFYRRIGAGRSTYGFIAGSWFYEIVYVAPARHYFDRDLTAVKDMVKSFRLTKL